MFHGAKIIIMLTLLIDAMNVNLSAGSSFEFYDRNPLFSKEGQHTLDIDIDLGDPQNAYVYHDMHRIDCPRRPSGRAAVLFSEKGIIIKGTEIVLEIDERKAKIQIVSGNSELNYLSGGDQTLRSLDLGNTPEITADIAMQSLTPGTYDFVCSPVCAKNEFTLSGTSMYANPRKDVLYNEMYVTGAGQAAFVTGTVFNPLPYLYAIVERVIRALGYTVTRDFIEEDAALRKLVVINGYHSQSYSGMLPNMLVDDFLTMVENFTGCVIVVDQAEKTVEILQKNYFYDSAGEEVIDSGDIIGEIQRKFDEDSPEGILYENVSYDFPKTETYNYWSIDKELWKTLIIEGCDDHSEDYSDPVYKEHFMNVWRQMNDGEVPTRGGSKDKIVEKYNRAIVYRDNGYSDNNLVVLRALDDSDKPTAMLIRIVNQYGGRYNEHKDGEIKLKIIPTEIVWALDVLRENRRVFLPIPFARHSDIPDADQTDSKEKGLNECINDGLERENLEDRMFVGFYLGKKNCNWKIPSSSFIYMPIVVPSNVVEARTHAIYGTTYNGGHGLIPSEPHFWEFPYFLRVARHDYGEPLCNMQINGETGMYNRLYKNTLKINFTQPVIIRFRSLDLRDSRKIFIIGNQRFFCAELKHKATAAAVSEVIEGTFYQVLDESDEQQEMTIAITAKVYKKENRITFLSSKPLPCDVKFTLRFNSETSYVYSTFSMSKGSSSAEYFRQLAACTSIGFFGNVTPVEPSEGEGITFTNSVEFVETKTVYIDAVFTESASRIGGTIEVDASEELVYGIVLSVGFVSGSQSYVRQIEIEAGASHGALEIDVVPSGDFYLIVMRSSELDDNQYVVGNGGSDGWSPKPAPPDVDPDLDE